MGMGVALLLAACGGGAAPAATPASSPPAASAAKPAASTAAPSSASAKPAASAASGASAKPAASAPAGASGAANGPLTKLRFRYPVQTGAWIPFMIAKDANIFPKYGLDVDVQLLQSTLMVPAMLNGEMDIAGTSAETIVAAYAKGTPFNIIGAMIPQALGYLVVTPDITKVEDLKGQTVVITGFGNVSEFALRRILAKSNLELGKDVQVRGVGTQAAEIAAIATPAGGAKGFMAYPPDDILAKRALPGAHSIFDVLDLKQPYIQASIFTKKSYIESNRPTLIKFLQATSEAIAIEKKDHDLAARTFMKYAKLDDNEAADRAVDFYGGVAPPVVGVSPEGVQNVMEVVKATTPEAANLDPKAVIDTSLTDEITKSGFVNQLK
jgi:ABC-type nitrate/sulfonate/bicarbonate transport system substrate-binding protein